MKDHAPGRRPYPSDVSDNEWAFVAPYLTLMDPDAPQREHSLRDLFNALRWIVRSGDALELHAVRIPVLGGGVLADAPLDSGPCVRTDGA